MGRHIWRSAHAGHCWFGSTNADEVGENGVEVIETVVEGNEVAPTEDAGVVPLAEDGGFYREGLGEEEGAETAGEGMAIDIDEVFVLEL